MAREFVSEPNPCSFIRMRPSSYKHIQFCEADVQLTFRAGTTKVMDGVTCTGIGPNIDYFKDLVPMHGRHLNRVRSRGH